MLSPTIDALAAEYEGKAVFGKLNTDENFQTASKYRISSIPTVLYFKGGELVSKTIGALPKQALESEVRKLLA
jgi:thioredoxin 1